MSLSSAQKLILAFVTLIIGVLLITQISTSVNDKTATVDVVGETHKTTMVANNVSDVVAYTVTNAPTGWKVNDCPLTNFAIKNASGTTLTVTTDYTVTASTGVYYVKNTTATNKASGFFNPANNYTYVDYTYCGDEYMNVGWGRTVMNIVPGFFAIALLLVAVALFYSVARESGLLGKE